jgi:ABC-type dipeptide/oligopeptide/nickel transport system permease subunit
MSIENRPTILQAFIIPEHFGHVRGSTFPDQVRDRLLSSESALPGFILLVILVSYTRRSYIKIFIAFLFY